MRNKLVGWFIVLSLYLISGLCWMLSLLQRKEKEIGPVGEDNRPLDRSSYYDDYDYVFDMFPKK